MALDRAKLAEFVSRDEGDAPPVFVGRVAVIEDILATADRSWTGHDGVQGRAKDTRILQGAPGAGKSTILAELARQAQRRDRNGVKAQVLILNSADIGGPLDILALLAARVDPAGAGKDFLARVQTTRSGSGQLGAFGSAITAERATTTTPRHPEPTLVAFREWVRDPDSTAALKGSIIVAIDEAQRLQYPTMHPVARLLQQIHDNTTGLPLTLVLAGLGDTETRAIAMDLTRGKTVHTIAALSDDEVADLTHRWCAHFGLDPASHADRLAALAAPCVGWPRHLHFALGALGRDVLRTPGTLDAVDWERVATEAAVSRLHYYRGQQRGPLKECAALVGAVLDALTPPDDRRPKPHRSHVIDRIDRHAGAQPGRAWQIPKDMDADSLADTLFHRGALQENPDGSVTFPIPSFRSYLVRDGIRMVMAGLDSPAVATDPTALAADRIISAAVPHTEEEIVHGEALAATWHRHCGTLAALAKDAIVLASVTGVPTDADSARATAVLAILDAPGAGPPLADTPALPRSLPHAARAVAALEGMVDAVRDAAQAIRDGRDDPFRAAKLGTVAALPEQAVAATPAQQLEWALEHLTGATLLSPDTPRSPRSPASRRGLDAARTAPGHFGRGLSTGHC